jgi:hypothetical protein
MITITVGSWIIPTAITLIGLIWALFVVDDGPGYGSGIGNIFALVPALLVSCVAWIIWGICK